MPQLARQPMASPFGAPSGASAAASATETVVVVGQSLSDATVQKILEGVKFCRSKGARP